MTKIDDGGSAYPVWSDGELNQMLLPGLSIRDYFAGQALAGLSASGWNSVMLVEAAGQCYDMADAMLLARATVVDAE